MERAMGIEPTYCCEQSESWVRDGPKASESFGSWVLSHRFEIVESALSKHLAFSCLPLIITFTLTIAYNITR